MRSVLDELLREVLVSLACVDFRRRANNRENLHSAFGCFLDIWAHGDGLCSSEGSKDEDEHGEHHLIKLGILVFGVSLVELGHREVK